MLTCRNELAKITKLVTQLFNKNPVLSILVCVSYSVYDGSKLNLKLSPGALHDPWEKFTSSRNFR